MHKKYIPAIVIVVLALVGSVATILVSNKDTKTEASDTSACMNTGQTYTLIIENDQFDVKNMQLERCDKIEVINKDKSARLIALGKHDHHIKYPGFAETSLGADDSFTFTAFKAGSYLMHDHIDETVETTLTIK